ncbi:MAG: DUF4595 domain-containing protein [Duncaniella sp.]|nr:DUF4595 domain-containing protein [Duncaniella sp.]
MKKYHLSLALIISLAALLSGCAADPEKNHGFSGAGNPGGEEAMAAIGPDRVFPGGLPRSIGGNAVKYDAAGRVTAIGSAARFRYLASAHAEKNGYNILLDTDDGEYRLCVNEDGWVGYAEKEGMALNLAYNLAGYLNHMEWEDAEADGHGEIVFYYEDGDLLTGRGNCSYHGGAGHLEVTLSYTGSGLSEPLDNKGGLIFMNHGAGGLDLGGLQWAYYAGLLGRPSRHLPLHKAVIGPAGHSTQEFYEWQTDSDGLPSSVAVSEIDNFSDSLSYGSRSHLFSWR